MSINRSDWSARRNLQIAELATVIQLAGEILPQGERTIEQSRLHGVALLAHSIELARGIKKCLEVGLPGAAAALARAQYEAALRGHIILHEVELDDLNLLLSNTARWIASRKDRRSRKGPPKIELDRHRWRSVTGTIEGETGYASCWQDISTEMAQIYARSVGDISVLHDLTHSGFTQSLQMLNPESEIEPHYSEQNQALLLYFTVRTAMFAIMTWPGMEEKYTAQIERKAESLLRTVESWKI